MKAIKNECEEKGMHTEVIDIYIFVKLPQSFTECLDWKDE